MKILGLLILTLSLVVQAKRMDTLMLRGRVPASVSAEAADGLINDENGFKINISKDKYKMNQSKVGDNHYIEIIFH
jgi:hypothetical protein